MELKSININKSYKGIEVVKGVSISLKKGEIVGLLGPNGAGKTTTFDMIVGLISPEYGDVFLNDLKITKVPMYKRAKMGIGYLPQEVSVFRKLSVEDNIKAILEMSNFSKQQQKEKLEGLINEFGLNHVRKNLGRNLSGGEKRRTEIARCLANEPDFILLDEPFAGVDPIAVEDIQRIVLKLKKKNIGSEISIIVENNKTKGVVLSDGTKIYSNNVISNCNPYTTYLEFLNKNELPKKVLLGSTVA